MRPEGAFELMDPLLLPITLSAAWQASSIPDPAANSSRLTGSQVFLGQPACPGGPYWIDQ
jgi:hypothetical protein